MPDETVPDHDSDFHATDPSAGVDAPHHGRRHTIIVATIVAVAVAGFGVGAALALSGNGGNDAVRTASTGGKPSSTTTTTVAPVVCMAGLV